MLEPVKIEMCTDESLMIYLLGRAYDPETFQMKKRRKIITKDDEEYEYYKHMYYLQKLNE